MVGVPRSKGCSVCRERRIKCDEARPECTQCRRYGCPCPGYNRGLKFQDEGPGLKRRHRQSRRLSSDADRPTNILAVATTGGVRPLTPEAISEDPLMVMRRHAAASIDESLSPSLVQKSFASQQPQLFMDFTCAAFPTLYFQNRFRSGDSPAFPEYIMQHFGSRPYQDAAVCCLSAVYLAHLTKDLTLHRTSRHMYAEALRKVNRALDTDAVLSDDMLSTVMMLTVYEMYAQTTKDAWVHHARAVKHLMIRRGVQAHMSGFGRSCYYAFRGFLIAHALYEGRPCFLDEEEWQDFAVTVRAEDSQKPGEWSVFVDISEVIFMELVKCPRYLNDAREITPATTLDQVASLAQRIRTTVSKLQTLSEELRSSMAAHSQRKQGIVMRPGSFVGPVPRVFPDTNPSLLLLGATSAITTLEKLLRTMRIDGSLEGVDSPIANEVISPTPSADSSNETVSSGSSLRTGSPPQTFTLPFRIVSEIGRGPSRTTDKNDPRAVTWLDRIASSMGMLGAEIVHENEESMATPVIEEVED